MTIANRLWLLIGVMVVLLSIIGGLSWWSSNTLNTQLSQIIQLTSARADINGFLTGVRANREQVMLMLQHDPSNAAIVALHDHPVTMHTDAVSNNRVAAKRALDGLQQNQLVRLSSADQLNQLMDAKGQYMQVFDATLALLQAGQYHAANEKLIKALNPAANHLFKVGDALFDVIHQQIQLREKESAALGNMIKSLVVISILLSLVLAVILGWMVLRSVRSAIADVSGAISQAATNMRFTTQLAGRSDEFQGLVADTNRLFSGLNQAISEANRVVTAIANADFSQRMTAIYTGDLDTLKTGVNGSASSVSFMMQELEKVMQSLNAGKFDVQMDNKVPKSFRDLVETALKNIHAVLSDINRVMQHMNDGDFNVRVQANAAGDMLVMKNNINASMDSIAKTISAISEVVGAQAQGDLTKELPSGSFRGQLHDLKTAINFSSTKVKETVIEAVLASNIVNDAAQQVSQGSRDLSGRVQQQAAALEQTSATMNEMAAAVQTNTANARRVADLANQVKGQSGDGVSVMQQTIAAMQSIRDSSSKIADIVTLIDGIAFQTNLLALNAAVEAARAGEHGRGFAVVAGEVRALAQKSADAAKDIKTLISDSVSRIENGTQLAEKSGDMLTGISNAIEQVAGMINEIATASHEQSIGINQVHLAMNDIDRITQENATLVDETSTASQSLSHQAEHLKDNMSFFKTGMSSGTARPLASPRTNMLPTPQTSKVQKKPAMLPAPASSSSKKADSNEWTDF